MEQSAAWFKRRRNELVAVRLVCEREETRAFEPQEYWSLTALLEGRLPPSFKARLVQWQGKKSTIKNSGLKTSPSVQEIVKSLDGASWVIGEVEKKERRRYPTPPFVTSKLQQEAARSSVSAQANDAASPTAYEGIEIGDEGSVGLITYMRTDSTRVSNEALSAVRHFIEGQYGKGYVPGKPNTYRSKKGGAGCPRGDSSHVDGLHAGAGAALSAARCVPTLFAYLGSLRRQSNGSGLV